MNFFAALKSSVWAYPALEVVHICGIALLLGNLVLLELRVFGLGAALPINALARLSLGLAATGFSPRAAISGLRGRRPMPLSISRSRSRPWMSCSIC